MSNPVSADQPVRYCSLLLILLKGFLPVRADGIIITSIQFLNDTFGYLKMLVILPVRPVTAPNKSVFREELITQIPFLDLIREACIPVQIRLARNGLDDPFPVRNLRIWVIQRIDIHRHSQAMLGDPVRMGYEAEIEA